MAKKKRNQIPNILTLLNASSGFIAITCAAQGRFIISASFIILAFFFDFADGFLARKLNAVSELGRELDSLADSISFVVAPSFLLYQAFLAPTIWGIVFTVVYVLLGIYRLARFNISKVSKYFEGMPTPMFAATVVAIILINRPINAIVVAVLYLLIALLMVTKLKFPSYKG